MRTYFYNRTAYAYLSDRLPIFFVNLDVMFDAIISDFADAACLPVTRHASNLCRRLGDVEFLAWKVDETVHPPKDWYASVAAGTFLVAYFSACKSVLDAVAVALADLYDLQVMQHGQVHKLTFKEQDLTKSIFWRALEEKDRKLFDRYHRFCRASNANIRDMIDWRDIAIHRVTPFTVPAGPGVPSDDKVPPAVLVFKDKDLELCQWLRNPSFEQLVDPTEFHRRWRNDLIDICQEVCKDIELTIMSMS